MTKEPEEIEFKCGCVFTSDERAVSACREHERAAFMFLSKNPVTRPDGMEPPVGVGGFRLDLGRVDDDPGT